MDKGLSTKISPCNCTGEGGVQIHLSRVATAFLVGYLDRKLTKKITHDAMQNLIQFAEILAADIKESMTTQKMIVRKDDMAIQEESERLAENDPEIVIAVGASELMEIVIQMMGHSDNLN